MDQYKSSPPIHSVLVGYQYQSNQSFDQSMNEIRKQLVKIIAEVAEETGAGVVLFRSAIVIAVKKLEVSQEVLKRLNEKLPTVKVVFVKSK